MKTILLVDDNEKVRQLVAATLDAKRYSVAMARSGAEAVEVSKRIKPRLIIMDVEMPGTIDGIEATRRIKNDAAAKDCIVIMLSAMAGKKEINNALAAGAIDYLVKPFSPLELLEKVEKFLEAG